MIACLQYVELMELFLQRYILKYNLYTQLLAPLDIGFIVTCPFDPDSGLCLETITTATPIGNALGLPLNTTW